VKMDKYIIRTKLPPREMKPKVVQKVPSKQSRIEELRLVVNLDGVLSLRDGLLDSTATTSTQIRLLEEAEKMHCALEILEQTGIGKAVHKLLKSEDERVKVLAQRIEEKWRSLAETGLGKRNKGVAKGLSFSKVPAIWQSGKGGAGKKLEKDKSHDLARFIQNLEEVEMANAAGVSGRMAGIKRQRVATDMKCAGDV